MRIYFDSSALVKLVVDEEGSPEVRKFVSTALNDKAFITSAVTKAEVMAAIAAMRRGRHLTQRGFQKAVEDFRLRWRAFNVPEVTISLIDKAGEIGVGHKIKGCDAFQLASALEAEANLFVSCDDDLNTAASESGLFVWNPMVEIIPEIAQLHERS